ncbi:MAG: hypothetical protein K2Y23_05945 [Cyanobacteria bacterium]|nr:hypothetical protein [Cyanobacteriota bacterium]
MIRRFVFVSAIPVVLTVAAACGGSQTPSPAPSATATPSSSAAKPAEAPKPAGVVALLEPIEGAMGGHIDTFRWSPVAGADGYVIKIVAVTGDRVVWESQPMTATEAKLPATVALEPEVHTWSVSARKGSEVLATSPTQKFTITP